MFPESSLRRIVICGLSADVEDPEFTSCPNEPIKLKLYYKASSQMTKPVATDNSGLVMVTVSPSWFSLDIPLDTSVNVTYTAQDAAGRTATCPVTIIVNGEGLHNECVCVTRFRGRYLFFL